jgi:UDP-N-acetylglucosamine--N-acetylmuramyl-(pentapeptide) pyrophosphoryl-undecaprenol N-acetylglucosamine transferase
MDQSPTIVLTGGGSGGHITPLLSLAQEIKSQQPDSQIVYIGHKGDNFDSLKKPTDYFDFTAFINGGKFRRYHGESLIAHLVDIKTLILNVRDFFRVVGAIFTSLKILKKVKPDIVFSKGGFVAVPVGIAAHLLRIPIITHDSDSVPGLANKIIGRWAVVNATGTNSKSYPYPKDRLRFVGIPVDSSLHPLSTQELAAAKAQLKLPASSLVLLISGGGHGSLNLNNLVVAVSPHLIRAYPSLHIIHIAGQSHQKDVREAYHLTLGDEAASRVTVIGFSPHFSNLINAADLIIGRAGASSLAEFALVAKPTVIMPSPFLAAGHQLKNAQELSKHDAIVVIDEHISSDELLVIISELLNNPKRRAQLSKNLYKQANPNAAADLASLILKNAHGNK